jgi:methylamine---glutamate N-methyltransferase subunit A
MCGIAGVIYRNPQDYRKLGTDLLSLIRPLESRGFDSCGVGLFGNAVELPLIKIILIAKQTSEWGVIRQWFEERTQVTHFESLETQCRITLQTELAIELLKTQFQIAFPDVYWMSAGQQLEVYKEIGTPSDLFKKYHLTGFSGTHAIAHTRMATESVVNTYHSHPFVAGSDLCIVHNGQISNYYKLRFALERQGVKFATNNDSEAIALYLRYQLIQGNTLEEAIKKLLADFDGTYTFLVATPDKIALVRDKFAAKPAVIYESETKIAIASEYRCLLELSDFDPKATIREPDAGEINVWSVAQNSAQAIKPFAALL